MSMEHFLCTRLHVDAGRMGCDRKNFQPLYYIKILIENLLTFFTTENVWQQDTTRFLFFFFNLVSERHFLFPNYTSEKGLLIPTSVTPPKINITT